jgi:hypothetical protein
VVITWAFKFSWAAARGRNALIRAAGIMIALLLLLGAFLVLLEISHGQWHGPFWQFMLSHRWLHLSL